MLARNCMKKQSYSLVIVVFHKDTLQLLTVVSECLMACIQWLLFVSVGVRCIWASSQGCTVGMFSGELSQGRWCDGRHGPRLGSPRPSPEWTKCHCTKDWEVVAIMPGP